MRGPPLPHIQQDILQLMRLNSASLQWENMLLRLFGKHLRAKRNLEIWEIHSNTVKFLDVKMNHEYLIYGLRSDIISCCVSMPILDVRFVQLRPRAHFVRQNFCLSQS